jgi:hypothetical protein
MSNSELICDDVLSIIFSFIGRSDRKRLSLVCRKYYNVNRVVYGIEENDKERLKYVERKISNKSMKI